MTEISSQTRVDQVNEILESVQKCEERMNQFMERLQWSRDKLPKEKKIEKQPAESVETTEVKQTDYAASKQSEPMNHPGLGESSGEFLEIGDRTKLSPMSYTDLDRLKRDMRRRRLKHRVTKAPPLTYTEEIRELIAIQMEIENNRHKDEKPKKHSKRWINQTLKSQSNRLNRFNKSLALF